MNDFKIRTAKPQDVSKILELIKDLARYEKLEHEVVATTKDLKRTLFGKTRYASVIVGEVQSAGHKKKPVSYALYFFNYSTFLAKPGLYLEDLFVLPEYRSKGYGLRMLQRLAQIAVKKNCGRMEWAVLDWNAPAIEFYKKLGAEFKKEWVINRLTGSNLKKLSQL